MSNIRLNWVAILVAAIASFIFEVRTLQIYVIYTGYYLIELVLIGAIVGAWKKKSTAAFA